MIEPAVWLERVRTSEALKIMRSRAAASVLALLGGLLYLLQTVYYAHFQDVTMDEGTYLMKGLLYVTGIYRPFQEYGPQTNKMPLAFLIPGLPQAWFEPGLRTGRYFAVVLGILLLVGLWLVTRRLAGPWWAAGAVWVLAASPANILYYSQALSQVIVACLLVWTLVMVAGAGRPAWQLGLGGVLAALVVLTRQNMLPLVVFVAGYVWWERGWRLGLLTTACAGLVLLGFHLVYWPNIMRIWLPWLPTILRRGLQGLIFQNPIASVTTASSPAVSTSPAVPASLSSQLDVVWEGFRYNFLAFGAMLAAWILWPARKAWKSQSSFKLAVSLSLLLVVLVLAHAWAALFKDYCLYCYSGYMAFFMPAGIVLAAVTLPSWMPQPGRFRQLLAGLMVLVCSTGIAFSAYPALDPLVMNLPVPRLRGLRPQGGSTELWRLLNNKFNWSFERLQLALPAAAGFLAALALIAIAILLVRRSQNASRRQISFGPCVIGLFLIPGLLLSPSPIMGGDKLSSNLCTGDVLVSHEKVGAQLRQSIPAGSLVYWLNNVSPLPLLYLPQVRIFPPQLNQWYNFYTGGDPDLLARSGQWNQELANRWLQQANYALVEEKYVDTFTHQNAGHYDELKTSSPVTTCRDRSNIHIFRRIQ